MKRKVFKVLIAILLIIFAHQIYWYIGLGGNLDLYLTNVSEQTPVNINLYLDGKRIAKEDFNDKNLNYKNHTLKVSPGKHYLVAKTDDGEIEEELAFYSFFIKRITIELSNEDSDDLGDNPDFHFYPEIVLGKYVIR